MDLLRAEALGQIGRQDCQLGRLFIDQIGSLSRLKLADGIFALLDLLIDDGHHGVVVEGDSLINFFLLDGSQKATDGQ